MASSTTAENAYVDIYSISMLMVGKIETQRKKREETNRFPYTPFSLRMLDDDKVYLVSLGRSVASCFLWLSVSLFGCFLVGFSRAIFTGTHLMPIHLRSAD